MYKLGHLILAFFISLGSAYAAEEPLYEAPPPEDGIFVRFLGFPANTDITWNKYTLSADDVSPGDYLVFHADGSDIKPGQFVTVLPDAAAGMKEFIEPEKSASKITIMLANISGQALSLKASDGKVEIVKSVASGDVGYREVNPISVSLQTFAADGAFGEPLSLSLRRREHVTILATDDGSIKSVISKVKAGVIE